MKKRASQYNHSPMNLQQLEYIKALEQLRHFGKAAEYCNVTQPTLSTMIQKLEDELGVKIFDRSRQAIQPTPVGLKILNQASKILRQVELLKEIVQDEENALSGHLTISVLPTIAPYLLPRLLPLLEKRLPELQITFIEAITSTSLEQLRGGKIDMSIIASTPSQEIVHAPLYFEEFVGYVSEHEPIFSQEVIRTSEVDSARLWLLDEGHCFRNQLVKFCSLRDGNERKHDYNQGSLETFMHLVEQGNGMTFIPELSLFSLDEHRKRLTRPFSIPRPTRAITLCTRDDFARTKLKEVITSCILEVIPEHMHALKVGQALV